MRCPACEQRIALYILIGFRQKTPRKNSQIYIQRDFEIILLGLLIYLGLSHFWANGVFPLPCMGLRLIYLKNV